MNKTFYFLGLLFLSFFSCTKENSDPIVNNENVNGEETIPVHDNGSFLTFSASSLQFLQISELVESLEYSVDDSEWKQVGTNQIHFGGDLGELRLRGKSFMGTNGATFMFDNSVPVYCKGDIRVLIDYKNYKKVNTNLAVFKGLFKDCTSLKSTPDLPSIGLADSCYLDMFSGCKNITIAPELPATELSVGCYKGMFANCQSLSNAPALPAKTLTNYCYSSMFWGCSSLVKAPELPATELAKGCYDSMFSYCSKLKETPELPSKILFEYCYNDMFSDCTSLLRVLDISATQLAYACCERMFYGCRALKEIPTELPAVKLAERCYVMMFDGCESLEKSPELPAKDLAEACYSSMFSGCSSLKIAPELPATELEKFCYSGMFYSCSSLEKAPDLPALTLKGACYYEMFQKCSSLNYVKMLAIDIEASNCLYQWMNSVSSSGFFIKNSEAKWSNYVIPSSWFVDSNLCVADKNSKLEVNENKINISSFTKSSGKINIITNDHWFVTTESEWIHVSSNYQSGTGNGDIYYSVADNRSLERRTGTILITGLHSEKTATITITQPGLYISGPDGYENGIPYIDLGCTNSKGRPIYWALYNLGASRPEDFGLYYQWGSTIGYDLGHGHFDWDHYRFVFNGILYKYHNESYGTNGTDRKTLLELEDDAANKNWGGTWRIPTTSEFSSMYNYCEKTWVEINGVQGYLLRSEKNGKTMFLPAAGWRHDSSFYNGNENGMYWSSELVIRDCSNAWSVHFDKKYMPSIESSYRDWGYAIRAVCTQ